MPRQPAHAPPSPTLAQFLETGDVPRRWAATNHSPGHRVESWLAASPDVREAEDPADTAQRNSLCGDPLAYETERMCRRCGPLPGTEYEPLCPNCYRRVEIRRIVVERADPVEYGPDIRWEEREIEWVERRNEDGSIKRDRKGQPQLVGETRGKDVKYGRLSEFHRAVVASEEAEKRRRLKISGNRSPDRVFLLPG